jgi:uncharacterized protein (TIGR03083 family)
MQIELLHEQTKAFADAAESLDLDARVQTCPEWSVRVLVGHIGQGQRWAAEIVRTGAPSGIPDPHDVDLPADWAKWLQEGTEELAGALRDSNARDANATVWTVAGTGPAEFWLRRMVHDTTVHYVDAAITAGIEYEIPEDLAIDGIQEGLELLATPGIEERNAAVAELRGDGQTLQFRPDNQLGWHITRTPEGVKWRHGTGEADVTMSGTAQDLLLLVYGRLPLENIALTGNRDLMTHWLAHTRF